MKDKKIIIRIMYCYRNLPNETKLEWHMARLRIFVNYTLKSLKVQTNQDFVSLLKCRSDMIGFAKSEINRLTTLPDNIIFVEPSKELGMIKELIANHKYFYHVRLDSDDMYRKSYINMLHEYKPKAETESLINQKGYIYDSTSKRLAPFGYTSPPYYTLIYKVEDFLKGFSYKMRKGHGSAILLKHEILKANNFMCMVHKHNKSTSFEYEHIKKYIGKLIENYDDKNAILREFGIGEDKNGEDK